MTPSAEARIRKCAADMYADPPRDCDAPFCGCNPAWSECLHLLQECGWKSPEELASTASDGAVQNIVENLMVMRDTAPTTMTRETCVRAITALSTLSRQSGRGGAWQPIETAPRDRTCVILGWQTPGLVRYGYYLDNSNTTAPWSGWRAPSMELPLPVRPPTHWQPLPPAPASPTKSEVARDE